MRSEKAFAVTNTGDIKMSGKFLARASALSLAVFLAACGGDDSSTPLVDAGNQNNNPPTEGSGGETGSDGGGDDTVEQPTITLALGTGSGSNFFVGLIAASATAPSLGEVTRLNFNVVDASDNTLYTEEPTSVELKSTCDNSEYDSPITSSSGSFSISYTTGCSGIDTVTAKLEDGTQAIVNLEVAAPENGTLQFVSVDPDSIALANSGGPARGTSSKVTFALTNPSNVPISDALVSFSISTTVGGLSLSQDEWQTSTDGTVSTTLNAGTVPTAVSVTATHTLENGTVLQSTSDPISVSASIPDQDSFSFSIDAGSPQSVNAYGYDGVEVPLTIRAADRNNNRVEGAVVNFLTSAGSVQNECILDSEGACTINWISQNPRADNGLAVILARTAGEESFRDLNSDGLYQASDIFDTATQDKGEAFLDRNWNGVRDADEEYFDYNSDGQYNESNGIYDGTACNDSPSVCTSNLLEVTNSIRIFMASDNISIDMYAANDQDEKLINEETNEEAEITNTSRVCAVLSGVFAQSNGSIVEGPIPGGTEITFSTDAAEINEPSSFVADNRFRDQPSKYCVQLSETEEGTKGPLLIEVLPPEPYSGEAIRDSEPVSIPLIL